MITYWHNPRCSKSRAGLALFEAEDVKVSLRLYKEDAPSADELRDVLDKLQRPVTDMIRHKDALFKDLGLSPQDSEEILLNAMVQNPALIERPIAITDTQAIIGRPTDALKALL
ncbi:arsenate reductase (glutaredoxin) [Epibacterium ulvae]|uniref:arsenate reductase (glutaredoxin) n=1 Tax=Epibacterium ulvae TaxID=1156985 RepID=UPI00248FAE1E|nr:arsenate reductase (glutaredoxin) [Epibacterium ulvae]